MRKPQGYGSAILSFKFEAAHRQPQVGGKCVNLHGHSWNVNITLYNNTAVGGITENGLSVEFSSVKDCIDRWINRYFDHATLLGIDDPLSDVLRDLGLKVYSFGRDGDYEPIAWPSVEAVAFCLGEKLQECITQELGNYVTIETVTVSETERNSFAWSSPDINLGSRETYLKADFIGEEPCA